MHMYTLSWTSMQCSHMHAVAYHQTMLAEWEITFSSNACLHLHSMQSMHMHCHLSLSNLLTQLKLIPIQDDTLFANQCTAFRCGYGYVHAVLKKGHGTTATALGWQQVPVTLLAKLATEHSSVDVSQDNPRYHIQAVPCSKPILFGITFPYLLGSSLACQR